MEPYYPIIELQPDQVRADETMGTKGKFWVTLPDDKEPWLFKLARVSDGRFVGEYWAEKLAAEVAALIDVPHAEVELATFSGTPGSLGRRFVTLSLPSTALAHGNALLAGHVIGYDKDKRHRQGDHTLTNILKVVKRKFLEPDDGERALRDLMGFLVLDALILNTDRHHENWAIIVHTALADQEMGLRMAPSFDHASSLGRNVTPSQLKAWGARPPDVARYVRNAPGAIYASNTDKAGLNPIELVKLALRVKPDHVRPWLHRLHTLDPEALTAIVHRVPPEMISAEQQAFTAALLRHTLNLLQQLTP